MANKFEDYNSSYITPQHTLLKKFNEIIKFLKENPTYNVYKSSANYVSGTTTYNLSTLDFGSNKVKIHDAVIFNNTNVGFIESVGTTTFTVLSAFSIKGETGAQGQKGDTGEITSAEELIEFLQGTYGISVDVDETQDLVNISIDMTGASAGKVLTAKSVSGVLQPKWESASGGTSLYLHSINDVGSTFNVLCIITTRAEPFTLSDWSNSKFDQGMTWVSTLGSVPIFYLGMNGYTYYPSTLKQFDAYTYQAIKIGETSYSNLSFDSSSNFEDTVVKL